MDALDFPGFNYVRLDSDYSADYEQPVEDETPDGGDLPELWEAVVCVDFYRK